MKKKQDRGGERKVFRSVLVPKIQQRLKGFPVQYVAYTVTPSHHLCCRLPSYLTSWPIQILSHSSSHHSRSLSLPHCRYFLQASLPPIIIIILLSAFLTPRLSCCFSTLLSLDSSCLFPPSNHPPPSCSHPFFFAVF